MTVTIRPATLKDSLFVLTLRNVDSVRNNSFNTNIIEEDEHEKFFKNNFKYYYIISNKAILMKGRIAEDAIGFIRMNDGEISIALHESFRGRGFGSIALKQFMELELHDKINAKVLMDNTFSCNFFKANGFKLVYYGFEWVKEG